MFGTENIYYSYHTVANFLKKASTLCSNLSVVGNFSCSMKPVIITISKADSLGLNRKMFIIIQL